MFAGSCIGVILLVMSLELLRHAGREYDRYLLRKATRYYNSQTKSSECSIVQAGVSEPRNSLPCLAAELGTHNPRVTLLDQIVRAGLRMLQFGVAYFIMLLAMSYNGYIISCITIGAFLGPFVFDWESRSME
jgi:copper transporter 1